MKNILLVGNSLEGFGGVEARAVDLIQALNKEGCHVVYLVCRERGKYASKIEEAGGEVVFFKMFYWWRGFPIPSISGCISAIRWIRDFDVKVILGLQPSAHYYARLLKLFCRRNVNVFAMERLDYSSRNFFLVGMDCLLSPVTKNYICVSKGLKREMISRAPLLKSSKIVVIEDGARAHNCIIDSNLSRKLSNKFVVGCVSRLEDVKRQTLLVEIFNEFGKRHPDWHLVLVGDETDDPGVRNLVERYSLLECVDILGHRDDVHSIYPLFDVFAFPSIKEGFGCVWAEAMAHEIPVISTDIVPMNDYIIDGDTGLLCPVDDIRSFYEAIHKLYSDEQFRLDMGRRGKNYIKNNLFIDNQLKKLIKLLGLYG